jgi:hypothetical protein
MIMSREKISTRRKENRKNLKNATIMLAAITTIVWLVLLIVKYMHSGLSMGDLMDDIISNILGILPPIIIFNFAYEYLAKDYMADEISEEITQTLMSNPGVMNVFDTDIRRSFVKSTISSLVGDDKIDMVYGVIEPYLVYQYDIRPLFEYSIDVGAYRPVKDCEISQIFSKEKYFLIKEEYTCKKIFTGRNTLSNPVRVGFFTDLADLDSELKNQKFVFRESLKVEEHDLQQLVELSDEEKWDYVTKCMKLNVCINNEKTVMKKVEITMSGISVEFMAEEGIEKKNEMLLEMGFAMPQVKHKSEFLVSLSEPTYAPTITFKFDEEMMHVSTYPFLDDNDALLQTATQMPGIIKINMKDWVYPVKGLVFIIEEMEEE